MSQNVAAFTELHAKYWEVWKQGKQRGLTDEQIGKTLHRSRQTITRLKNEAKENGAYKEWINETLGTSTEEFWELHQIMKNQAPQIAYTQMGRLIEKSLVQRIESSEDIYVRKEYVTIDAPENEADILSKAVSILERKRKSQRIH